MILEECESTNDLAKKLALEGAVHGSWVSARRQSAGRGRQGRRWESQEGNLFLSLVARPRELSHCTWVPLATAVGAIRAVRAKLGPASLLVKWPNDLWVLDSRWPKGAKVAGVLCEAVLQRPEPFVVIGLGLNCAAAPEGLDQATACLSEVYGRRVVADDLREEVIAAILGELAELERGGPARLRAAYDELAVFSPGQWISWGGQSGRVLGLGDSGELRVAGEGGAEVRLLAEDVRVRP